MIGRKFDLEHRLFMIQRNGFGKRQGDVQDARIIAGQYRQMVDPQLREVQRKRRQVAGQLVFGERYHAVHAGNIHKRAIQSKIMLTTMESALFELLKGADKPGFKEISKIVK